MTPTAISSLLAIWSVASFLFEVPSGAWADIVERRALLVLSAPLLAAGFAVWIAWPTYPGFATGFVLWALSSALMSGTFEALLYDELAARGASAAYAGLLGWANSAAMAANLAATASAAVLVQAGGYPLVGAVSIAVALVHGALAWSLPSAPPAASSDQTRSAGAPPGGGTLASRYRAMLVAGVSEATAHADVRRLLVLVAVLYGLTAYDEYFGLVAREAGAATAQVPLLIALTVCGQLVGSALAGRTAGMSPRALAGVIAAAGTAIAAGALAHHALGFVAIAVGYGLTENATVVADAELQDRITGPARATVTSVSGLSSEVVAVGVFATMAAGSSWASTSTLLAVTALPMLLLAAAARRWWPTPRVTASAGEHQAA
jgi:MFS family permease